MQTPWTTTEPLGARLTARLATLQAELAAGERRLAALDGERGALRDTLMRITGAIAVLEEQLADEPSREPPERA